MKKEQNFRRATELSKKADSGEVENAAGQLKSPSAPMGPLGVRGVDAVAGKDRADQALAGNLSHKQFAP